MSNAPYVVIAGFGRSGSNLLLDLLDLHAHTLCRNEPGYLVNGAMAALPDGFFEEDLPQDFLPQWHRAVEETAMRNGNRDRLVNSNKDYFKSRLLAIIGLRLTRSGKFRNHVLGWLDAEYRTGEWNCSPLFYDLAKLRNALPVFKNIVHSGWVARTHKDEPGQYVVHIVRNPNGFINSWWNRYVAFFDKEKVFSESKESAAPVLKYFNEDPELFSTYSEQALIELELWRWRYVNEILFDTIDDSPRYIWVNYDTLMSDRIAFAKKLFPFVGLDWESEHEAVIKEQKNTLFRQSHKEMVDQSIIDNAVSRVMANSPYKDRIGLV